MGTNSWGTVEEQVCLRSQYLVLRGHDREHLGEQLRLPRRGSRSGLVCCALFSSLAQKRSLLVKCFATNHRHRQSIRFVFLQRFPGE